jgi:hypothetical protein
MLDEQAREAIAAAEDALSLSLSLPSNTPPPTTAPAAAPPESCFLSLSFLRGKSNPSLKKA